MTIDTLVLLGIGFFIGVFVACVALGLLVGRMFGPLWGGDR